MIIMKEPLKDRIDVLIESAKNGDGVAQLKLSKYFYEGHLVEKSIENAKYWAFKATSADIPNAESYYNAITRGAKLPLSDNLRRYIGIVRNIEVAPICEFFIGLFGIIVFSKVTFLGNFFIWLLMTGMISGILGYVVKHVYHFFAKCPELDLSAIITIFMVHIVSIYYGISFLLS